MLRVYARLISGAPSLLQKVFMETVVLVDELTTLADAMIPVFKLTLTFTLTLPNTQQSTGRMQHWSMCAYSCSAFLVIIIVSGAN